MRRGRRAGSKSCSRQARVIVSQNFWSLSITRGRQPDVAYGATGGSTFVYKIMARGPIKRMGGRPRVLGKSSMLVARVPDTLLTVVDEVGKEHGARGRSESLRKALELLRELKGKKR